MEITAKKQIEGVDYEATVVADLGDNLADATAKFGEDVVFSNFKQSSKITCQAAIRRMLEMKLDQAAITEKMAGWKPGVSLDRSVDPVAALKARMSGMSKKEKEAYLADLLG